MIILSESTQLYIPTNKNGRYVSSHNLMVDHQVLRTTNVLTQTLMQNV
jgi:hypothetical protein